MRVPEIVSNMAAPAAVRTGSTPETSGESVVVLRVVDLFAISVPLIFGLTILSSTSKIPNWLPVSAALIGGALFGVASRIWASRSDHPVAQFVGNYYVILCIWFVYSRLNPIIDLLSPVPYDRDLQAIDQWIFGVQPSVWLERFYHPWLTELLFICYSLFFLWQLWLGILLYLRKNGDFEDYITTVVVFYMLSYIMYIMVPAIGPRFDIVAEYQQELHGVWLGDRIKQSFVDIPMLRDCFPSGHTGLTTLVLFHALHKKAYRFFALMLPFGLLLIFSTVYCRFHYVVDLMCAFPFIAGVWLLQVSLKKAVPQGLVLSFAGRSVRARLKA